MTRWVFGVCLGLSVIALGAGYGLTYDGRWSALWLLLGVLWWLGRRRWRWVGSLAFLGYIGAAAGGVFIGLGEVWMLLGTVAALAAWDLDHFAHRLQEIPRIEQQEALVASHLQRLALVSGGGLLLGIGARLVQVRFSLGAAVLLGLLAILGLQQFLAMLRRESD